MVAPFLWSSAETAHRSLLQLAETNISGTNQIMFDITLACHADAAMLPAIERSADQAFRALPTLAWVAGHEVQTAARHAEIIDAGYCWVARNSEEIVGFLSVQPFEDSLHIWQMAVHADFQKKGIGRALMDTLKSAGRHARFKNITLTTFRAVAWNEIFYTSCNFETLSSPDTPLRLQLLLEAEARAGLPSTQRCAMMCHLL